jgi:proteasome accessory factor B
LLRLITTVQSRRGLKVPDLARLCEVHERTIHRDLNAINAAGIPCGFDAESQGYRIGPSFFMPSIELTIEEGMAIVALLDDVGDGTQVPFLGAASRAAEKLRSQLPRAVLDSIDPVDSHVHIDLARAMGDDSALDVYNQVRDAIAQRRILRCRYDPAKYADSNNCDNADTNAIDGEFDLKPYDLWFCQRAWYVVGHHSGRNAIRRLKLNRFTSVQTTDRPFAIPDDFDLRADLGQAWRMIRGDKRHRIAIRFEPAFADAASETRWHPTQEEEWNHDTGQVTLRFSVDGLDEIVWWVLSYGPGATVLEPTELIERVRQLARATAGRYSTP